MTPTLSARALALYSAALIVLLALSAYQPHDLPTWALEVAPVAVVLIAWARSSGKLPAPGSIRFQSNMKAASPNKRPRPSLLRPCAVCCGRFWRA